MKGESGMQVRRDGREIGLEIEEVHEGVGWVDQS